MFLIPSESKAVVFILNFSPRWQDQNNWPGATQAEREMTRDIASNDVFQASQNWSQSITDTFPLQVEVDWNIPLAFGNDDTGVCGVGGVLTTQGVAQGFASEKPKTAKIIINSNLANQFFYDPTPNVHEEFNNVSGLPWEAVAKLGGPAAGKVDLLSCAKHEFGHTMGFMRGAAGAPFAPYTAETNDGFIDLIDFSDANNFPVVVPYPVAGPLNDYDKSSHFRAGLNVPSLTVPGVGLVPAHNTDSYLMVPMLNNGARKSMSPFDISTVAKVLGLANGNGYDLAGKHQVIPEPATASLLVVGAIVLRKRRHAV